MGETLLSGIGANWAEILKALGSKPRQKSLPTVATCPLCKATGSLRIFYTARYSDKWCSCRRCQFAGTLLMLASAAWKLDTASTLRKLWAKAAIDPMLGDSAETVAAQFDKKVRKPIIKMQNLWKLSQEKIQKPGSLKRLIISSKLQSHYDLSSWKKGMGRVLGACSTSDVHKAYYDFAARSKKAVKSVYPKLRIFLGPGWDRLLIMPLMDLPGSFTGFYMIGRDGSPDSHLVIPGRGNLKPLPEFAAIGTSIDPFGRPEQGFFGIPFSDEDEPQKLVILDDVLLAAQLHAKHFSIEGGYLPVIGWHPGKTPQIDSLWQSFPKSKKILWTGTRRFETIYAAMYTDSLLSFHNEWGQASLLEYAYWRSPNEVAQIIAKSAAPWNVALAKELSKLSDDELDNLLVSWPHNLWFWSQIRRRLPSDLVEKIERSLPDGKSSKIVELDNGWIVIERNGGIYTTNDRKKPLRRICNAIIRVERVGQTLTESGFLCSGYVEKEGVRKYFITTTHVLDNEFTQWIRDFGFEMEFGYIEATLPAGFRISDAIFKLAPPMSDPSFEIVGWSDEYRGFLFPNGFISDTGEVQINPVKIPPVDLPGSRVILPVAEDERLLWAEIVRLGYIGQLIWAFGSFIVHRLLAPRLGLPTYSLIVVDPKADSITSISIKRMLNDMGCPGENSDISMRGQRHTWPVYVPLVSDNRLAEVLDRGDIVKSKLLLAMGYYLDRELQVIMIDRTVDYSDKISEMTSKFVPTAIQYIAKNNFELNTAFTYSASPIAAIVKILADHVDRRYLPRGFPSLTVGIRNFTLFPEEQKITLGVFGKLLQWACAQDPTIIEHIPNRKAGVCRVDIRKFRDLVFENVADKPQLIALFDRAVSANAHHLSGKGAGRVYEERSDDKWVLKIDMLLSHAKRLRIPYRPKMRKVRKKK